ncbi:FtsX-like permease family protein [Paucibacter sp. APW11]|uniref:FtsX-like permease family protein n=1 Tax=Roseateles aquae TaxID=3077235 RepID=A0ABU3P632_9BURK|nr:FtsX-like permease family protein [Paucibacter sp. APW11]MDT8997732.1 FtsX-like permease family protein [Paucibacter sp. APW11]
MMLSTRLALRNLLRNRRRSLLTALVIVCTLVLMTVFQGLSDGGHRAMIEVGVRMGLGHLIVNGQGYVESPSLNHLIGSAAGRRQALARAVPQASQLALRLRLNALIQAGGNTVAITASGGEAELEAQLSGIADQRAVRQGQTLAHFEAQAHAPQDLPGIVIGERLAQALGVMLGDRVTLTVKPAQGQEFSRSAFQVVGLFRTGMVELDSFWAEIGLLEAQKLAQVKDAASHIALYLSDDTQLEAAAQALAQALHQESKAQPLQMQRWNEAAPELQSAVSLDAAGMVMLQAIVIVVVAAGILNTVVLSVMNRTREFGVMLALGCRPGLIVRTVFIESICLAGASVALGLLIGFLAHLHFASVGLNFREIFGTSLEAGGVLLPERFFSVLNLDKLALTAGFVFALTLLVTTLPALKASRLTHIQSSRHA